MAFLFQAPIRPMRAHYAVLSCMIISPQGGSCVVDYWRSTRDFLQVDGYQAYEKTNARLVGCMAHTRRKFVKAVKALKTDKIGKADWAVNHLQKLYRLEKRLVGKDSDERYRVWQEEAKPLMDSFRRWLEKSVNQVALKTLLGTAIQYSLNHWDKLYRYLDDGRPAIDNNSANAP